MAKPTEICEEFRRAVYAKYEPLGWKFLNTDILIPNVPSCSQIIPYEDFMKHVNALEYYDHDHIVVSLTESKIYELSSQYTVDMLTKSSIPGNYGGTVLDDGANHLQKIRNKELAVEELAGYNHLAVFLRWAYEHDLLSEYLLNEMPSLPSMIADPDTDLRTVIADAPTFNGRLKTGHFNKAGKAFAKEFYAFAVGGYPSCVDRYAEKTLGTEEYHSDRYKNEAYLFVPYNETYYYGLSQYIDTAWNEYCCR